MLIFTRGALLRATVMALFTLLLSSMPVRSAGASPGTLSDDQYAKVRQLVWAADKDFGGYSVDFKSHTLVLHPVAEDTAASPVLGSVATIERTDDGLPKVWTVQVSSVPYSLAELRAVQDRILTRRLWSEHLSAIHVDTAVNAVHLGFIDLPATTAQEAQSLFGSKVQLVIESGGAGATRANDSPPWWGGDSIYSSGSCTGGFPVIKRSTGVRGILTAGHCFGLNSTVYQGSNTIGTVRWRSYSSGAIDLEFFDAPSGVQGVIYAGCQTCDVPSYDVNGLGAASVGAIACSDGYVSAPSDCTVGINWIDGCMNVTTNGTTVWTCGLAEGIASDNRIITQAGDSGGPMYRNVGGGFVQTYGSIVGNSQPPVNGQIQPSTDVVFTEWQYISSTFQAICYTQSNCG